MYLLKASLNSVKLTQRLTHFFQHCWLKIILLTLCYNSLSSACDVQGKPAGQLAFSSLINLTYLSIFFFCFFYFFINKFHYTMLLCSFLTLPVLTRKIFCFMCTMCQGQHETSADISMFFCFFLQSFKICQCSVMEFPRTGPAHSLLIEVQQFNREL